MGVGVSVSVAVGVKVGVEVQLVAVAVEAPAVWEAMAAGDGAQPVASKMVMKIMDKNFIVSPWFFYTVWLILARCVQFPLEEAVY